jgi:hypothetical protein
MAAGGGKLGRHTRTWTPVDTEDPSDVHRLCNTEQVETTRRTRCISTWTFSLIVLAISVLFLLGLLVGYYIRESDNNTPCESDYEYDGGIDISDADKLEAIHNNIMYDISGDNVLKYIR